MNVLSFEQEWTRMCPRRPQLIFAMRAAIGKKVVNWKDLTTLNLVKIRDYFCENYAGNTPVTYLAEIKAFLGKYRDEGIIPCKNPHRELKAKRVPSQHVYLTEDEIERIEQYVPKSDTERDVKAAFLIECYLGARRSDVERITLDDIVGDKIIYVSKKTNIECKVPIHKKLLKYLQYIPTGTHDPKVEIVTIQRICKNVGIVEEKKLFYHGKRVKRPKYEYVGTHTARRSFCSNLARRGVDIYTIAALAGHGQNIAMTQRYIVTETDNISDKAMEFFNG